MQDVNRGNFSGEGLTGTLYFLLSSSVNLKGLLKMDTSGGGGLGEPVSKLNQE